MVPDGFTRSDIILNRWHVTVTRSSLVNRWQKVYKFSCMWRNDTLKKNQTEKEIGE